MKRWSRILCGTVVAAGTLTGCKQQLYLDPTDQQAAITLNLPRQLEADPSISTITPSGDTTVTPPTVRDPDRPARPMTLAEALAIALEQGNRGVPNIRGLSFANAGQATLIDDTLQIFNGNTVGGDDSVRAFTLDPAITGANIEASLAKFDVRWLTNVTWAKNDNAVANLLANFSNGDSAAVNTSLVKPLPTGGLAGITLNTNYSKLSAPPTGNTIINPSYSPSVTFQVEQPLWQSYGVEINQLLASHPGAAFLQNFQPTGGGRVEGILITRIRYEQSRLQFERDMNQLILNVESAYWNLYAAYGSRYASEQGVRQSYQVWNIQRLRLQAGKASRQDEAEAEAQLDRFRAEYLAASQAVLEAERQLRRILGLPSSDGQQILPVDNPTLAEYTPDWNAAIDEMYQNRPELLLSMQDVKFRQLDILVQRNGLKPDLRAGANYNVNGIGTSLDGSDNATNTGNALGSLAHNNFNTWNLFLRMSVPLGFRDAHSALRVGQLQLARSYIALQNQREKAKAALHAEYQQLFFLLDTIKLYRKQREALERQLIGIAERIRAGDQIPTTINLLNAQNNFASALRSEFAAIAAYNATIAAFQFQKGTIMNFNNIVIADGTTPQMVLSRASEHERMRSAGILARERADAVGNLPPAGGVTLPPSFGSSPALPAMLEREKEMRRQNGVPLTGIGTGPNPGNLSPNTNSTATPPALTPNPSGTSIPANPPSKVGPMAPPMGMTTPLNNGVVPVRVDQPIPTLPETGTVTVEPLAPPLTPKVKPFKPE